MLQKGRNHGFPKSAALGSAVFLSGAVSVGGVCPVPQPAGEALELCEYSVLSEYHRTLWERYELFYLDLGYGGGAEKTAYLNQQVEKYLNLNLKPGKVKALETWDYARATDQRGMAYYEQAVSVMKAKTGCFASG